MPAPKRKYKDVTFQQLRSFYETAQRGSLSAAATALGLSQPTVWLQVHALERSFGAKLVEPFGRGCRLTDDGRILAELAAPAVLHIGSLKARFDERRAGTPVRLRVAVTPRTLLDDLPDVIARFRPEHPNVQLTLSDMNDEQVVQAVETGAADLGLAPVRVTDLERPWRGSEWLDFEPCYELDTILVTPPDHPLARKRKVHPNDLADYPIVNGPIAYPDPRVTAVADQYGLRTRPQLIEANYTYTIRQCVLLGYGIGLIGAPPRRRPRKGLHERDMSEFFGRSAMYQMTKKGAVRTAAAQAFVDLVRDTLGAAPDRPRGSRRPKHTGQA